MRSAVIVIVEFELTCAPFFQRREREREREGDSEGEMGVGMGGKENGVSVGMGVMVGNGEWRCLSRIR